MSGVGGAGSSLLGRPLRRSVALRCAGYRFYRL